uniref:Uncharacterized protein n=1 Tax=Vitis vinifera TaxID=29760 RepID=F6GVH4_VITVI
MSHLSFSLIRAP